MKKFLLFTLAAVTFFGCYDDDDLWEKVNELDERVESLESTVSNLNEDITTLQALADELSQGLVIVETEETETGYTLTFSDGSTVSITNGTDGTDAPVIGIQADSDGIYYWTITTDGETTWLLDSDGNQVNTGITPVIGVDEDGYWTVDTGSGAEQITDSEGNPIKAEGTDGDSFFLSVVDDTENNVVILTLSDGTEITIAKAETVSIGVAFADDTVSIQAGTTETFTLVYTEVSDCFLVSVTDGWSATLSDTELTVTAPSELTTDNTTGLFKLIAADEEGTCKLITLSITAYELVVLTFEDEDYKGSGNYLGYSDWSSLIDSPQYGGTLLYGDYYWCDYCWYDENNTYLKHEFPTNWSSKVYWGGGHAISNYVEMDLSNGTYLNQLAVYYQDETTGMGGHNGSSNFCVHYGYVDDSGYSAENLPYFYFGDDVARVVDHMYVTMTTYLANCVENGNGLTEPADEDDYVKLVAIGFDENDEEVDTQAEFYLVGPEGNITEWTKWDLSVLGEVSRVEFNVTGSNDNGYGFSQPAYFAYDDVAVRF